MQEKVRSIWAKKIILVDDENNCHNILYMQIFLAYLETNTCTILIQVHDHKDR